MSAGYSKTPLLKKLGIKPGYKVLPVNAPQHYFELLGDLPQDAEVVNIHYEKPIDFIHAFAENEKDLHNFLPSLKEKLAKDGSFWVSWIKESSKMKTDINGNDVRKLGLEMRLVDVKVCAVDENWSGLKFMYRKEGR